MSESTIAMWFFRPREKNIKKAKHVPVIWKCIAAMWKDIRCSWSIITFLHSVRLCFSHFFPRSLFVFVHIFPQLTINTYIFFFIWSACKGIFFKKIYRYIYLFLIHINDMQFAVSMFRRIYSFGSTEKNKMNWKKSAVFFILFKFLTFFLFDL